MIGGAAASDRVFLQQSQRRCRLPRIENHDPAAGGLDEAPRSRRDAGEPLQKVQRRPLTDEERARGALDLGDVIAGAARGAVANVDAGTNARLELPEGLE